MRFARIVLLCVMMVAIPWAVATAATPEARPMKIGYVDLTRLLKEYPLRAAMEKGLEEVRNNLAAEENKRMAALQEIKNEMDQLARGTPDWIKLEEKGRAAIEDLKEFRRASMTDLNKRLVDMLETLYGDVIEEVNAVGREGKYDLIIKEQSREQRGRTRDEVVLQISQRVVLYSKPDYDLTSEVLRRLKARPAAAVDAVENKAGDPNKPNK